MAANRPTISAPPRTGAFAKQPSTGSTVLDDIMSEATGQHRTVPPPASPPPPTPEPATAAPAVAEPAPVVRAPRASTGGGRRARSRRSGGPSYPGVPPMPEHLVGRRQPLQVYIDPAEHWALKQQTFARGVDMSQVVAAMVQAFNFSPDQWLGLMELAEERRMTLGELVAPALKAAEATA